MRVAKAIWDYDAGDPFGTASEQLPLAGQPLRQQRHAG